MERKGQKDIQLPRNNIYWKRKNSKGDQGSSTDRSNNNYFYMWKRLEHFIIDIKVEHMQMNTKIDKKHNQKSSMQITIKDGGGDNKNLKETTKMIGPHMQNSR